VANQLDKVGLMSVSSKSSLELYDTHAHLTDRSFHDCFGRIIADAKAAGLIAVNVVGFDAATSRSACELATMHDNFLFATVGIQPNSAAEALPDDWATIESLADHDAVRGIGETGLDRYWKDTPWDLQQDYFDRHIELSRAKRLPLVIHMRECGQEIVDQLKPYAAKGSILGVMHSYTGDWDVCKQCLDLGLMISFAGMITFKKSEELRTVAKRVPADRILVETDCPYLSPEPFRGKRPNEPSRVEHTLRCLASTRGERPEDLAVQTTENAKSLFAKPSVRLTKST
jgi:TatD DNase family protein